MLCAEVLFILVVCCIGGKIQQDVVVHGIGAGVCAIWRCSGTGDS